jgi:hypothetical protein
MHALIITLVLMGWTLWMGTSAPHRMEISWRPVRTFSDSQNPHLNAEAYCKHVQELFACLQESFAWRGRFLCLPDGQSPTEHQSPQ